MNRVIIRYCDTILACGLPILGFAITVAVYPSSFHPLYIKTLLLHIGTAIIGTAWIIKQIEARRIDIPPDSIHAVIAAAFFLLSALLSYFFISPYRTISLEELLQRIPYVVIFLIASTEFMAYARLKQALVWLAASAAVAGSIGILQHLHIDFFKLKGVMVERIPSTFGNPNFYVGFLALILPVIITGAGFTSDQKRNAGLLPLFFVVLSSVAYYYLNLFDPAIWMRFILLAVLFAVTVAWCVKIRAFRLIIPALIVQGLVLNILLTFSRSGHIAFAAGLLLLVAYYALQKPRKRHHNALLVFSMIAIIGITIAGTGYLNKKRHNSVTERKYYLLGAIELIRHSPIFGHGIGTFKINYPLNKPADAWAHQTICFAQVRNVYNEFLEIVHDEGVVGGLLFVWVLAAVFWPAIRVLKKDSAQIGRSAPDCGSLTEIPPQTLLAGLMAGVIALLISNMISLNMRYVSTGFHFWYLLGIIVSLAGFINNKGKEEHNIIVYPKQDTYRMLSIAARSVVYALLVCSVLLITIFSTRLFAAGIILAKAVDSSRNAYKAIPVGDGSVSHDTYTEGVIYRSNDSLWEHAIRMYGDVVRLDPYSIEARYFLGNAFTRRYDLQPACNPRWGDAPNIVRTDFDRALEQYDVINRAFPHYAEADFELGNLYMKRGMLDTALHFYLEHKKYKPFFIKTNHALARCYVARKEFAKAEEAYLDALDNNEGFTRANVEISVVYHMLKQPELEKEFFNRAFEVSPEYSTQTAVQEYEALNAWDKAIEYQRMLIEKNQRNGPAYAKLGDLYMKKNDPVNAIASYTKASECSPENAVYFLALSNLYFLQGALSLAEQTLAQAVRIDPVLVNRTLNQNR